jgi:methionyl-tRNA formyltransferase
MRIVFVGSGEIGLPTLHWLHTTPEHELVGIVTETDKPAGRQLQRRPTPIKVAASVNGVPIIQPKRIRSSEAIAEIQSLKPDVIVVMAYGQILPAAILPIPRLACLNLHASLLPRWRGAAPIQAAIAAGDGETGLTVTYMDEGLDTGDILLQRKLEIQSQETGGSLHDRLAEIAPAALAEALSLLERGSATRLEQDAALATYAPKLTREDGRIDWKESAEVIERKVRAFNPWPVAFTCVRTADHRERRLKIFEASVLPDVAAQPGKLFSSLKAELVFGTAEGALKLIEVQPEGSRRMTAVEFLRGNPVVCD